VVSGHRDTHFSFLKNLKMGEIVSLTDRNNYIFNYSIVAIDIVDSQRYWLRIDSADERLTLVTCYPFEALAGGGKWRYVVTAVRI
jgi:sortase A